MGRKIPKTADYVIFTDGSHGNEGGTGFGVVIVNLHNDTYTAFGGELGSRSINFAENYAVFRGVAALADMLDNGVIPAPANVLIISDNKNTVDSYRKWIRGWEHQKNDDGVWVNLQNDPVSNQFIFRDTMRVVRTHPDLHVSVVHIHSHLSNKDKDWLSIQRSFEDGRVSGFNEDVFEAVIHFNALADDIAVRFRKKAAKALQSDRFFELKPTSDYYTRKKTKGDNQR